jgi:hypothetical protein
MKIGSNYRKLTVISAVVTMMLAQIVTTSVATTSPVPSPAYADADISAESRTLDAFVIDLGTFDKKGAELAKKASLTRAELDSHERTANDLKRRVSGIQSALVEAIRKLKAAGQWENIDQIVLAKISDSRFQDLVRREGFKKTLEEAASGLSNHANEIVGSLDVLRNKVKAQAQDPIFEPANSTVASRVIRVAYTTAPAMFAFNIKCRLAYLRVGFSGAVKSNGQPTDRSVNAMQCYCEGSQPACDAL